MGDRSTETALSEATAENAPPPDSAVILGAQGRNRTADTGIFNPLSAAEEALQLRADVGLSCIGWDANGLLAAAEAIGEAWS